MFKKLMLVTIFCMTFSGAVASDKPLTTPINKLHVFVPRDSINNDNSQLKDAPIQSSYGQRLRSHKSNVENLLQPNKNEKLHRNDMDEKTLSLKSILKNPNEKVDPVLGFVPRKPVDQDDSSTKKPKSRIKNSGTSEKKSQKKIVRPENMFLVAPTLITPTQEVYIHPSVADLEWILKDLSRSGVRFTPAAYKMLETQAIDIIHDKFGNDALDTLMKRKHETWSCDNYMAAMHLYCLRTMGYSETVIAHYRCQKTIEYALQVAQEFKDTKFIPSNIMKRD